MEKISVLIPVYNEEIFIEKFIDSLVKQKLPEIFLEYIFIDNMSNDKTIELLEKSLILFPDNVKVKIITNEIRIIAKSLNKGLNQSEGEIIIRLDVHSEFSANYISEIYKMLKENHYKCCNVGGVTIAHGYDKLSNIFSKALSSKWVLGGANFRYSKKLIEVDTLFPGAWMKKDLMNIHGWDEDWKINEDAELNCRLKKTTGKTILLDPKIKIKYHPRNTFKGIRKQYVNYGFWRIKTAVRHNESIRKSHLLPFFILIFLVSMGLIALINPIILLIILFSSAVTYIIYVATLARKIFLKKERLLGGLSIIIIQSSWIFGSLKGYFIFGIPLKGYIRILGLKKYETN